MKDEATVKFTDVRANSLVRLFPLLFFLTFKCVHVPPNSAIQTEKLGLAV